MDYGKGEWVYECVWKRERERDRKKEEGMENQSICDSLKLAQFGLVLIT